MDYKLSKLSNGLRVVTVPMPSLESVTLMVWVRVGSRWENAKISGISHFLEHMVFKGSNKRPTALDIAEAVDAIGGEFNASTSKEYTNFYIKSRVGVLETAFDVLSDMVLNPILREDDLEREKGVIVEEIGMYEDTPTAKVGDLFENLIFDNSQLGVDIIGSRETVRSLKRSDFEDYRKIHYFADNIILTIAGGVKEDKVISLAQKYFGEVTQKSNLPNYQTFKGNQKSPKLLLNSKSKEQAHFILGFEGRRRGEKDRFAEAVLAVILGGGMSSRLFTEIREKRGLAYAVKTSTDHYIDTGYFATYAGVDPKRVDDAISVMLDQHYGLASGVYKITDKELNTAKEYLKGHLALALEDTKDVAYFFGEKELLLGKVDSPESVFELVDKVTREDVLKIANEFFKKDRLNLAIIGPYNSKTRFERLLK